MLLDLMFTAEHADDPSAEPRDLGHESLLTVARLIAEGRQTGDVRPGDPVRLAQVASSTVHGLADPRGRPAHRRHPAARGDGTGPGRPAGRPAARNLNPGPGPGAGRRTPPRRPPYGRAAQGGQGEAVRGRVDVTPTRCPVVRSRPISRSRRRIRARLLPAGEPPRDHR
ncbi:hypothetical protein ACFWSF_29410 [Streptomyces sp. NPDC058611]|uniref:hypothetical protein n=1 Tax=unclassified Streptomyces TaxID=2593676 RepID=UPI0036466469